MRFGSRQDKHFPPRHRENENKKTSTDDEENLLMNFKNKFLSLSVKEIQIIETVQRRAATDSCFGSRNIK